MTRVCSLVRATTNATIPGPGHQIQQEGRGSGDTEEGRDGERAAHLRPASAGEICPCRQSSRLEADRTLGAGAGGPTKKEQGQGWPGSDPAKQQGLELQPCLTSPAFFLKTCHQH